MKPGDYIIRKRSADPFHMFGRNVYKVLEVQGDLVKINMPFLPNSQIWFFGHLFDIVEDKDNVIKVDFIRKTRYI